VAAEHRVARLPMAADLVRLLAGPVDLETSKKR